MCRRAGARSVDFSCAAVVSSLAACLSMVAFLKSFQHARGSPRARRVPASSAPPETRSRAEMGLISYPNTHKCIRVSKKKKKKMSKRRATICRRLKNPARRAQGTRRRATALATCCRIALQQIQLRSSAGGENKRYSYRVWNGLTRSVSSCVNAIV